MKKFLATKEKGVTLIETLIYVAIFATLVTSLSSFALTINSIKKQNQIRTEIHEQGSSIMQYVTRSIRNSNSVLSPSITNSGGVLILETLEINTNPTTFNVVDGILYVTEGLNDPIALNNNKIKITNLNFTNYARVGTPDTINISFKLSNSDSNQNENSQYSLDFFGGASIR